MHSRRGLLHLPPLRRVRQPREHPHLGLLFQRRHLRVFGAVGGGALGVRRGGGGVPAGLHLSDDVGEERGAAELRGVSRGGGLLERLGAGDEGEPGAGGGCGVCGGEVRSLRSRECEAGLSADDKDAREK